MNRKLSWVLLMVSFWALLPSLALSTTGAHPQRGAAPAGVPDPILRILNRDFRGWQRENRAEYCGSEAAGWAKSGDLDGDGTRDWAVKVRHTRRSKVVAFLSTGKTYKAYVVYSNRRDPKDDGMQIAHKRERFVDSITGRSRGLVTDAIVVNACESSTSIFIYDDGRFIEHPQAG